METVLVIRKPDATIHQVPIANKAVLMAYSNRLPEGLKWQIEEMRKDEASKLPFIDINFVKPAEVKNKLKVLEAQTNEKDNRIAELEKMLAAANAGSTKSKENAVDVIGKINAAASPEEVKTILGNDDRKTVQDAAAKKMGSFDNK